MLTKPTSVEFHSHRDVATPCFGMNTHVTSFERTQEAVRDNEVPFKVSKEDLQKINVFIKKVINMLIIRQRLFRWVG